MYGSATVPCPHCGSPSTHAITMRDGGQGVIVYGLTTSFLFTIMKELLKVTKANGIVYYYQCDDTIIELPQSLKIFRMHTAWEEVRDAQSGSQPDLYKR